MIRMKTMNQIVISWGVLWFHANHSSWSRNL